LLERYKFARDVFINTAGDCNLPPMILDAASRLKDRPDTAAMRELLAARCVTPIFAIATCRSGRETKGTDRETPREERGRTTPNH